MRGSPARDTQGQKRRRDAAPEGLSESCPGEAHAPPTRPVSYSSVASGSFSSATLAKLLALDEERDRSPPSGMQGALGSAHAWVRQKTWGAGPQGHLPKLKADWSPEGSVPCHSETQNILLANKAGSSA